MHRRSLIITVISAALLVSLWPVAAHANLFTDAASSVLSGLLELVADMLDMVRGLLIEFIAVLGTLLNAVISQPELSYGGAAVYTIWKLFRDICNILFIVMFIFISFGTIFNVVWKNPFHYSSALRGVIVAAIVINFSLSIGQTVVWAGNFATGMAVSLISGKDVGTQIAVALQLPQVVIGQQGQPVSTVPDEVTPLDQQNPIQRITSAGFTGNAKTAFENCLKFNQQPTVDGCNSVATRIQAVQNAAAIDFEMSRLNQSPSLKSRLQDAWSFWSSAARGAATGASNTQSFDPTAITIGAAIGAMNGWGFGPQPKEAAKLSDSEYAQKILSLLLNVFLLLVLTLSFLTVILFLVIRIPMIWLLLSFSSLAFFSSVWPGSDSLKKWFNNLLGWCIFSPLYLLVIYIGLFLLAQQNTLLAGMKNAAFISGSFGIILFYIMTAAIFIGGARYAMKYAFALSAGAGKAFGAIGGVLGVSEATGFGLKTVGAYPVAAYTGAAAGVKGRYEREITKPLAQRRENIEARYQARFGDRKAMETLERKRIEEQSKKNKELGLSSADLLNVLKSKKKGSAEYFAAAKELLDKGDLPADQMQEYVTAARQMSAAYGSAAQEAVSKKLREQAKEKRFKGPDAVKNATAALTAITDATERKKFLGELKKNSPLVYAQLATGQLLAVEEPGLSAQDIIENNTSKLEAEDLPELMKLAREKGWTLGESVKYRRDTLLNDKNNVSKMMDASDADTRRDLKNRLDELKGEVQRIESQKATVQAEASVLAQERLEAERENRAQDRGRTS